MTQGFRNFGCTLFAVSMAALAIAGIVFGVVALVAAVITG